MVARELGEFIEILPPMKRVSETGTWAPRTPSTRTFTPSAASSRKHVLMLSGDHIYKMNYQLMLDQHGPPART